jgi:hypothetical protein
MSKVNETVLNNTNNEIKNEINNQIFKFRLFFNYCYLQKLINYFFEKKIH